VHALEQIAAYRLAVILKARQLGMSWLTVGFGLWEMIFRPAATVLLFSRRDDEAVSLAIPAPMMMDSSAMRTDLGRVTGLAAPDPMDQGQKGFRT
jgi:hypothetical protein